MAQVIHTKKYIKILKDSNKSTEKYIFMWILMSFFVSLTVFFMCLTCVLMK